MVARCVNPECKSYKNYGGRGVEVRFTQKQFLDYMKELYPGVDPRGMDIDRIDNNGHYEVGNLRLIDRKTNLRNRRNNNTVTYKRKKMLITHVWHVLKYENPNYSFTPQWTNKLLRTGHTIREIKSLDKTRESRKVKRSCTISSTPDLEIVSLYMDV
jgi:hypothetical protein